MSRGQSKPKNKREQKKKSAKQSPLALVGELNAKTLDIPGISWLPKAAAFN